MGKPTFEPDSIENLAVNNLYAAGAGAALGAIWGGQILPSELLANGISGAVVYDVIVGVKAYQHGGTDFIWNFVTNSAAESPSGYLYCGIEQGMEKGISWFGSDRRPINRT